MNPNAAASTTTTTAEDEDDRRRRLDGSDTPDDRLLHTRRPSRHDGGLCMREQDADWLESIHVHGGPNKTGMTPVLTSQCVTLLDTDAPLPPFSLFGEEEEAEVKEWGRRREVCAAEPGLVEERTGSAVISPSSSLLPLDPMSLPPPFLKPKTNREAPPSTHLPLATLALQVEMKENHASLGSCLREEPLTSSSRRVLSGTIYETEESSSSMVVAATDPAVVPLSATVLPTHRTTDAPVYAEDRSAAAQEQRKMTEAAQFAEAVNDGHYELLLQIIEEDDDDDECDRAHGEDDDDDEATEIIHIQQQQRNPVGGLLPIKLRGSVTCGSHGDLLPSTVTTANGASGERGGLSSAVDVPPPEPPLPTPAVARVPPRRSSPRASGFLAQLPHAATSHGPSHDFVYKGIGANPPDIVKRGTTRGNYAQLHRKAWLEVTDKYHRYGKNLRLYYRYWESEGHPTNIFFDWLDSKGDAAGNELPELPDCPRRQLDSDTVLYITNPAVTQGYAIQVVVEEEEEENVGDGVRRGRMYDVDGQPVVTGPDGWIFVLRDNVLYGAKKITSISGQSRQRFHHSSFFGGKAVAAAGIFITDDQGFLTRLYPHSGHYRPGEAHMQRVLFFLYHEGVDLRSFEMDTQQIMHVARDLDPSDKANRTGKTEKKKKVEALHLLPAFYIACFLAHKARCIGEGLFAQIHQIRQTDVASVSEALAVIDQGGVWHRTTK